MDAILRAVVVYLFLLVLFHISGKRSMSQITTFDFVLLLIIAETTQQALLGEDFSVTNCFLLVIALIVTEILIAKLKQASPLADRLIDGLPLVLLENGKPLQDRMERVKLDESDLLAAAREKQGLERLDQIKYAVLERSGGISIIPKSNE
jgi:uncharacterized membrane protein YcaP (DUF421 family)